LPVIARQERAIVAAKAKGAKRAFSLSVRRSTVRSCDLWRGLGLSRRRPVTTPIIPVVHNVDAGMARDAASIRAALAKQAASPVRWVETVQAFVAAGVTHVFECGPGQVLTGLCKRIAPDLNAMPMNDGAAIEAALAASPCRGSSWPTQEWHWSPARRAASARRSRVRWRAKA
jgi:[acyl-carrier-protein] S-malonyltransferase